MAVGGLFAAGYVYRVIAPALAPAQSPSPAPPTPVSSRGTALALALALFAVMLGFAPPELFGFLKVGAPLARHGSVE